MTSNVPLPGSTITRAIELLRLPVAWIRASADELHLRAAAGDGLVAGLGLGLEPGALLLLGLEPGALLGRELALGLERDRLQLGPGGWSLAFGASAAARRAALLGRRGLLLGGGRASSAAGCSSAGAGGSSAAGCSSAAGAGVLGARARAPRPRAPRARSAGGLRLVGRRVGLRLLGLVRLGLAGVRGLLGLVVHQVSISSGFGCWAAWGCSGPA